MAGSLGRNRDSTTARMWDGEFRAGQLPGRDDTHQWEKSSPGASR